MPTYLPIQLGSTVRLTIEADNLSSLPINLSRTVKIAVTSSITGLQNLDSVLTIQKNTILGSYLKQVYSQTGQITGVVYDSVADAYWQDISTIQETGDHNIANSVDAYFRVLVKPGDYNPADLIITCSIGEVSETLSSEALLVEVEDLIAESGRDHLVDKGTFNATTGIAYDLHGSIVGTLADNTGISGEVYKVIVAGTQDFGSGPVNLVVDDLLSHNGTAWMKLVNANSASGGTVDSIVPGSARVTVDNTDPANPVIDVAINPAFRGSYDASSNLFPSTGGGGSGGAILAGDHWIISVGGMQGADVVEPGDFIYSLVDTPGQIASNWQPVNKNIGYTPENVANKENTTLDTSISKYPTNRLVKEYTDAKVVDAINDGVTTSAPSQNAVFDALATKANYNKITVVSPLAGTTVTYTTLQAAFNAISSATTATEARQVYTVYIPSGVYDEDVTIQLNNKKITVVTLGSVSLGTMTGASWGTGGTPRNLTINTAGSPATIDSIRSGIVFTSLASLNDGFTSHQAYLSKFRISGNLVISSTIGITSEVYMETEVFGNLDATGYVGNLNLYLKNSRVRGTVSGVALIQEAIQTSFTGLVSATRISYAENSIFSGGITLTSATSDLSLNGFYNCNISGTFTGPVSSARFDGATNYKFIANAATLAGGATKVIVDDAYGYTPENQANKENTTLDTSTTKYPTNRLVKEYADAIASTSTAGLALKVTKAGEAGGQTVAGGTLANETLELKGSNVDGDDKRVTIQNGNVTVDFDKDVILGREDSVPAPYAHYHLNETSGTAIADSSGNARTLTLTGSPTREIVAPKLGAAALKFTGGGQYLQGSTSAFNFDYNDSFSVTCWIRMDAFGGSKFIVGKGTGVDGWNLSILANGEPQFEMMGTGSARAIRKTINFSFESNLNVWHLVTVTYSGTRTAAGITMKVNGIAYTETVVTDSVQLGDSCVTTDPFQISGMNGNNSVMTGCSLDEVVIYNEVLSANDQTQTYNGGAGTETLGLTGNIAKLKNNLGQNRVELNFDANTGQFKFNKDGSFGFFVGTAINEFSIDGSLAGNSDLAVPTEKAVKFMRDNLTVDAGNF